MAEGSYEYECNRAELLGIDPPNKVDFEAALKVRQEEIEKELSNELETVSEQINSTSGKFDELNSILSVTQQRLNKFKTTCGSLTNLLKLRGNQKTHMPESLQPSSSDEPESSNSGSDSNNIDTALEKNVETTETRSLSDLSSDVKIVKDNAKSVQEKMSCQFGKLDALLSKAENTQNAMAHQNKQIKSLLK